MERHGTHGKKAASDAHDLSVEYVALYMRVSSEDQAERGTIGAQRDFLRNFAQLYNLTVIDEYADDGISGAISLSQRLDGKRLLTDAQAGRFRSVLVYRVDRLGRSLTALLEAHTVLSQAGVTIRSATEPFDTSTPIGTFLFQLLGSLAELEKSTIAERMSMGRNRVAKDGRWTNGPIPFGYDLDQGRRLVPSTRIVPELDMTEAEAAHDIFERIAGGSTTVEESRRLNALGVPTARRYSGNVTVKREAAAKNWLPSRLNYMIRSTVYKGVHVFKSKSGPIERDVPALVEVATWERAQIQLQRNRSLPKGNEKRVYLLRGLITCNTCGAKYVGFTNYNSKGWKGHYYRCGAQLGSLRPDTATRCASKTLRADWIEDLVWEDCRQFILNPGEALEQARKQLQERLSQSEKLAAEQHLLQQALAEKALEKDRIMTLFRRGRATLEDAELQLETIEREAGELRTTLSAIQAQNDLSQAYEAQYSNATTLLTQLQNRIEEIERSNDVQIKRQVIELLVAEIHVKTTGKGRGKQAEITITYSFTPQHVANSNINSHVRNRDTD